mgnify:CR=1 FL=1
MISQNVYVKFDTFNTRDEVLDFVYDEKELNSNINNWKEDLDKYISYKDKHLKKYSEEKPDMVIMDITMPNMDGLQALKKIREGDPNAKVVMCTAMGQESMVVDAIKSGARDFVVKPFDAQRIVKTVNDILGK